MTRRCRAGDGLLLSMLLNRSRKIREELSLINHVSKQWQPKLH
ncbi:hypothetical protein [Allocoleopsis franciscana]|nr:hypothetical protein [Allocoleopsis franciscana]